MYFLLSGEGRTDLGVGDSRQLISDGEAFQPGPMAVIVGQIVEDRLGYSPVDTACCGLISEQSLTAQTRALKAVKKKLGLPGKKKAKETRYFFNNARALSIIAKRHESVLDDIIVAVLFRDADTASAGRGVWEQKRQSMLNGFDQEGFARGVPMIPKPTSEAWILCALKDEPYRHCGQLEDRSSSKSSSNPLKMELAMILGDVPIQTVLCAMIADGTIDINRIEMNSFVRFRARLEEVI